MVWCRQCWKTKHLPRYYEKHNATPVSTVCDASLLERPKDSTMSPFFRDLPLMPTYGWPPYFKSSGGNLQALVSLECLDSCLGCV